jgi:hypothetical protein
MRLGVGASEIGVEFFFVSAWQGDPVAAATDFADFAGTNA